MSEIILGVIIIVILGGFGWYVREEKKETSKLINAILAKDSTDYVSRTLADGTEIKPDINPPTDLIPESQLSQDEFEQGIEDQLNG